MAIPDRLRDCVAPCLQSKQVYAVRCNECSGGARVPSGFCKARRDNFAIDSDADTVTTCDFGQSTRTARSLARCGKMALPLHAPVPQPWHPHQPSASIHEPCLTEISPRDNPWTGPAIGGDQILCTWRVPGRARPPESYNEPLKFTQARAALLNLALLRRAIKLGTQPTKNDTGSTRCPSLSPTSTSGSGGGAQGCL